MYNMTLNRGEGRVSQRILRPKANPGKYDTTDTVKIGQQEHRKVNFV